MPRQDGRRRDELRTVKITRGFLGYPEGSALIEMGRTRLVCAATIEERVPHFLKGTGQGWVTGEYGMLPRSTSNRQPREAARIRPSGRILEIQRMIGRSLRAVTDRKTFGERTITLDCDVLEADGGTRTAAVTGAFVALHDALTFLKKQGALVKWPLEAFVAAVSVGVVEEEVLLDLNYGEDSRAQVDMNVVMTEDGRLIEIQGTGEERPYTREEMDQMLTLAVGGIERLVAVQRKVLGVSEG